MKAWLDLMLEGQVRYWAFEDFMLRKEAVMKEIAEYVGVHLSFIMVAPSTIEIKVWRYINSA